MKRCPKCQKTYADITLNFCTDDGTPLRFDAEAETLPYAPAMSPQDSIMEIANILRNFEAGGEILVRFDSFTSLGLTVTQVSKYFPVAAEKAGFDVIDKTDTRATIRRKPSRLIRG